MPALKNNGMVHVKSPYPVSETLQRLEALLATRHIPILARIDHGGAAAKADLKMRPTELLIFGNARAGTPLMIASPTLAIDLPLKALVWEDGEGQVWLSYNSPEYLQQRHDVPHDLLKNIAGVRSIIEEAASRT